MDSDDDDDDMADLFSFGSDAGAAPPPPTPTTTTASSSETTPTTTTPQQQVDAAIPGSTSAEAQVDALLDGGDEDDDNYGMDDSFLKMLDEQPAGSSGNGNGADGTANMNDQETQDILNWLEEDDTDADALLAAVADESLQKSNERQQQEAAEAEALAQKEKQEQLQKEQKPPKPVVPLPPPPPTFATLKEALESSDCTKLQLMDHWEQQEQSSLQDKTLRPLLWSRVICGKSVDELTLSSLADSFQAFDTQQQPETSTSSSTINPELEQWIRTESAKLAPRVVRTSPTVVSLNEAEEALRSILVYHYHNNNNTSRNNASNGNAESDSNDKRTTLITPTHDPLLPPVVCAILSAGVPKLATPVLLSHMIPAFMPFVALNPDERWEAAKGLHSQFYLLACYHLPMLVYHLDRYVPGWYWPQRPQEDKELQSQQQQQQQSSENGNNNNNNSNNTNLATYKGRHLKDQGVIPPSWLMTHLVGECGGTFLDPQRLLQLLDLVFTNENNSLRFFLVLAVLEQHSDTWLELTGDELMESLLQNMTDNCSAMTMEEWAARAQAMKQATPDSVVDRLRTAEDEAVRQALKTRQKLAEADLKARLEAEAAAHREAQERKAEEARMRLTRARLVAYYRRFNPTKEGNVDKIMVTYRDKFEELDAKLKKKYGVGFNPAINPNKKKKTMTETYNESVKKTMDSMTEGIKKMSITTTKTMERQRDNPLDDNEDTDEMRKKEHRVSVSVKVGETLPFICMSRDQANDIRRTCLQKDLPMPLRYYLVDCRSEETAEAQGRFPTAARLSPETLMDPEQLQLYEESFETVRGSFHICIMGEGHSAIPALYNQKITPQLEEYMREDESRTNNCALFFVKRGFPFVSVLEGGFASAHAWLVREGAQKGFDVKSLLVDYNTDVSLFGQMEKIRHDQKATAAYKTQRALQGILDQSLATIVRGKMQLDGSLAAEVEATTAADAATAANDSSRPAQAQQKAGEVTAGISNFFGRRQQAAAADTSKQPALSTTTAATAASGDHSTTAPATAPVANRFSRWKQAASSAINANDEASQPAQPTKEQAAPPMVVSRFGGFGFGNAAAKAQPMIRRNPFARFGGTGGAAQAAPAPTTTAKATMARSTSVDSSGSKPKAMARTTSVDATPTIVVLPPKIEKPTEKESEDGDKPAAPAASIRAV